MPAPASPVRALPIGKPSLRPLSPEGLARLHAASLRILAETGVAVGGAGIRDRLAAAGVRVDGDRVRLPAPLIEAALAAAPRAYTLAAREPAWDLPLDGAHGYLSVDGSAAEILDLDTGLRRPSTERTWPR
jgi:trimethylamine--corrinoid protein Co-methyltransferase